MSTSTCSFNQIHGHDSIHALEPCPTADKTIFGFWIYVMTDAIMFATLFAVYAVLHNNTFGGPGVQQVANLHHMLIQTLFLIFSAFTFGLCFSSFHRNKKVGTLFWLCISFVLGLIFLNIEFHDLSTLFSMGYTWQKSAFLSSYFALLGIHGIHIAVGLLWMFILFCQLISQGFTSTIKNRFTCLGLFWNFLNLIWLLVFSIVFLMGAI